MDRLTRKPEIPGTAASPFFKIITFPQGHNQALSEEKSDLNNSLLCVIPCPLVLSLETRKCDIDWSLLSFETRYSCYARWVTNFPWLVLSTNATTLLRLISIKTV